MGDGQHTAIGSPVPHCVYVVAFANEGAGGDRREIEVFDFIFDGFIDRGCDSRLILFMDFVDLSRALTPSRWYRVGLLSRSHTHCDGEECYRY
jgi:hypothetical protein